MGTVAEIGFWCKSILPFHIHYLEARTNGGRPAHRVLENKADQLKDVGGVEGRRAYSQFIQYAADRPEVCSVVIWSLFHQLWRHIEWCAFDRCQHHCVGAHGPGKSAKDDGMEMGRGKISIKTKPGYYYPSCVRDPTWAERAPYKRPSRKPSLQLMF